MTVDNCLDYLILADWTHAQALKDTILSFISQNRLKIKMKVTDWKKKLEDHPPLLVDVVDFLFDQ